MKGKIKPRGFALGALCFIASSAFFFANKQFATAGAMAGAAFLYAALAYRYRISSTHSASL
jgi:hypothetical protein